MHHYKSIEGDEQKPEIITQYIAHKRCVDNRDHLAGAYSVKLNSNRWPVVVFCNIRDIAAISSYVVRWLSNFPNWRILKHLSHRCFYLQALGEVLVVDLLQQHVQNPHAFQKAIKSAFDGLVILDVRQQTARSIPAAKKSDAFSALEMLTRKFLRSAPFWSSCLWRSFHYECPV